MNKFEVQGSPMMAGSCIDLLPLCPLLAEVAGRAGRVGGYRGGRARGGSGTGGGELNREFCFLLLRLAFLLVLFYYSCRDYRR